MCERWLEKEKEREIAKGKERQHQGESDGIGERMMAQGRGCDHQGKSKRNDIGERITVKMFELKREEFERAFATNGNLQPKKPNTMGKEKTTKKTLEPLNIPYFTPYTHMSNS